MRGDRTINLAEAAVVRRIFRDYAAGKSPKRIATELNKQAIPAPGGGQWGFSTLNGNVARGNAPFQDEYDGAGWVLGRPRDWPIPGFED